jgi:hypothetical protein
LRFSQKADITFAFNLCGEYVFGKSGFASGLYNLLPKIDLVFGNAGELRKFAKTAKEEGVVAAENLVDGLGKKSVRFCYSF